MRDLSFKSHMKKIINCDKNYFIVINLTK